MSLIRKLEKRDYGGGVFSNPAGLLPGQIPTNGQLAFLDYGGQPIATRAALRHWAVWACVRIISDAVSTLPVDQFTGNGVPVEPVDTRLVKPSAYASMMQWRWQVMASLLTRGNAYGLISARDRLEYPRQVDIISPEGVQVDKDDAGHKVFRIGPETLSEEQVWHLPGPQLPGELAGMSPLSYAARTITLGLDASQFTDDFFRNGIHPTAVLETDQQVNKDQAAEIKDRVKRATAGRDMAVLGAGLKLNPWQLSVADAKLLETQQMNAVMISQIYGVPPEMLGTSAGGSSLTYANREHRAQDFLNNAVNPWLVRLEEALSAWFPRGTYVKLNTGALLRSDLKTRYQSHEIGIRNNFLLPSEAREIEDLDPLPGVDAKPLPGPGPGAPVTG